MNLTGKKYDNGKDRWDLFPMEAAEAVVEVLEFGAKKYGANNWQGLENFQGRYYAALQRHIVARLQGEEFDQESGLRHLAHAGCCLVFLLSREVGFDQSWDFTEADIAHNSHWRRWDLMPMSALREIVVASTGVIDLAALSDGALYAKFQSLLVQWLQTGWSLAAAGACLFELLRRDIAIGLPVAEEEPIPFRIPDDERPTNPPIGTPWEEKEDFDS